MTGGVVITGNDATDGGMRSLEKKQEGFYLLSYIPSKDTFSADRRNSVYQIRVKLKNKGYAVRHRSVFRGTPMSRQSFPSTRESSLQQVLSSPFRFNELRVSLSAGYSRASKPAFFLRNPTQLNIDDLVPINEKNARHSIARQAGFLIRSRMHLDSKHLAFATNAKSEFLLSLEFGAFAADCAGAIKDSHGMRYDLTLNSDEYLQVNEKGIDLEIYLVVQNPGGYNIRAIIRDRISGKSGSAFQYMEIPLAREPRVLLSSIFIINNPEDAANVESGELKTDRGPARRVENARLSPAGRSYLPGETFDYLAIIYNPQKSANQPPQLETQVMLMKDGKEYLCGEAESVDIRSTVDFAKISIKKRFVLREDLEEGDYAIKLKVTDKSAKEKLAIAYQAIGFIIRKQAIE
jgi:hypothetical protein